jgi:alpha-galactosidase
VVSVLPRHSAGWLGHPGLIGHRVESGGSWSVTFDEVDNVTQTNDDPAWADAPPGAVRLVSAARDYRAGLAVRVELELLASGLVRLRGGVENLWSTPWTLGQLRVSLPVPDVAAELLDLTGRHNHEREPQRHLFSIGSWVRESRGGRPGHDSATVLCAGRMGFGFRHGSVWGVHIAWGGNQVLAAERTTTGWRLLGGGELLTPGEVVLGEGESYLGPWLVGSWGEGLDDLSSRFHRHLRGRPQHPTAVRSVLLNTWEATYFKHDPGSVQRLADRAAQVGVERFVLDDGWSLSRRDDTAGLGDWYVDPDVWPEGLRPLADHVHGLGMRFGLWFEPEMVNLDSDLARTHPEWIMGTEHGPGLPSRHQHVLNLALPEAYDHVLGRVSAIVRDCAVDYVKWDHNRPLLDAGGQPSGRPVGHEHALAVHRMMSTLKERHPGLEIESCAGGGGRVDLHTLEVTDRVWVSDCIDPYERHRILRWTGLLLPPELMGTHVGSSPDHVTGRTYDLHFRAATAMWGHLGIECDLNAVPDDELRSLAQWIQYHKDNRTLLHTGTVVHADTADPAVSLEGVVALDGSRALYRLSLLDHPLTWPLGPIRLPGLRAGVTYKVTLDGPPNSWPSKAQLPPWAIQGVHLSGATLESVGLTAPLLRVCQAVVLHATAEGRAWLSGDR